MKTKISYIWIILLFLSGCASYKTLDLRDLHTGMTREEVDEIAGVPRRILVMEKTDNGLHEVFEYRTWDNDAYALEFWNNYLTGFEFLYEGREYIASPAPPVIYPPIGRPLMPPGYTKPSRPEPGRPSPPRPTTRPTPSDQSGNTGRPSTSKPSEGNTRPTTRPAEGSRPVGSGNQPQEVKKPDRTGTSETTTSDRSRRE